MGSGMVRACFRLSPYHERELNNLAKSLEFDSLSELVTMLVKSRFIPRIVIVSYLEDKCVHVDLDMETFDKMDSMCSGQWAYKTMPNCMKRGTYLKLCIYDSGWKERVCDNKIKLSSEKEDSPRSK